MEIVIEDLSHLSILFIICICPHFSQLYQISVLVGLPHSLQEKCSYLQLCNRTYCSHHYYFSQVWIQPIVYISENMTKTLIRWQAVEPNIKAGQDSKSLPSRSCMRPCAIESLIAVNCGFKRD